MARGWGCSQPLWGSPMVQLTALAAFFLLSILAVVGLFALEREAAAIRTVRAFLAIRQTPLKARAHLKRQRAEIATVLGRAREWLEQGE